MTLQVDDAAGNECLRVHCAGTPRTTRATSSTKQEAAWRTSSLVRLDRLAYSSRDSLSRKDSDRDSSFLA
jgi:hypothetical protein